MKALYASFFILIFLFGFSLQIESKTVYINPITIAKFRNRFNLLDLNNATTNDEGEPRFILTVPAAGIAGLKGFLLGITKGSLAGLGFGAGTAGLGVLAFEHFNMSNFNWTTLNPASVNWTALSSSIVMPSISLPSIDLSSILPSNWTSMFGNWGDSSSSTTQNPICIITRRGRSEELTLEQREANKPEIITSERIAKQNRFNRNRIRRPQNVLINGNRRGSQNRLAVSEDGKQYSITGSGSNQMVILQNANVPSVVQTPTAQGTVSCIFIRRGRDSGENNLGRQAEIPIYKLEKFNENSKQRNQILQSYLIRKKLLKRRKLRKQKLSQRRE